MATIEQGSVFFIQGEDLTILSDGNAIAADDSLARTQTANQEKAGLNGGTGTNTGSPDYDVYGLRPGYTGTGYLDLNGPAGAKLAFDFEADAGAYDVVIRLANGSSSEPRTLRLGVDGTVGSPVGTQTGQFFLWELRRFQVDVGTDGTHHVELSTATANGANIDAVMIVARGEPASFVPPVISTGPDFVLDENTLGVGSVAANAAIVRDATVYRAANIDADGQAVTFALAEGADAALFEIDPATGAIAFRAAPDFETAPGPFSVTVLASDGVTAAEQVVTINVTDVNEAPVLIGTAADVTVAQGESLDLGLSATDPDAGDVPVLVLRGAGGAALPAGVTLAGGSVVVAADAAPGIYALEVAADDGALASAPQAFALTVPGVVTPPPAPPAIAPIVFEAESGTIALSPVNGNATVTVANVQPNGNETPGTGKILDEFNLRAGYAGTGYIDFGDDAGDTVSYSVTVAEAGEYDLHVRYSSQVAGTAPRPLDFAVNGATTLTVFPNTGPNTGAAAAQGFNNWGVLTLRVTLDAGANDLSFAIPAGKTAGPNLDALVLTSVGATPNFAAPAFTSPASFTIEENTTEVGMVAARDLDNDTTDGVPTPAPTYAIAGGADAAAFAIDTATGALSLVAPADFETKTSYDVIVAATDGQGAVTEQAVSVAVTDVDDTDPVDAPATAVTLTAVATAENVAGAIVADIAVADPDTVYGPADVTLSGPDAALFRVVGTPGALQLALADGVALDFEAASQPSVTVSAGGITAEAFVPTVTDVDENVDAPATAVTLTAVATAENVAGAVVADIAVADPDTVYGPADVTLSGPDAALFRVVGTPGALQLALADGVALDFEAASQPSVTVSAGGITAEAFVPTVTDVDEGPRSVAVRFDAATIAGYSTQDSPKQGGGVTVAPDGSAVTLDGNLWKRVPLGESYALTGDSRIEVTIKVGAHLSEIVGIGFDSDNDPFDADHSIYQLAGSQDFAPLNDLRGGGTDNGDGTRTFVIDLGAHAGETISSLVLVADDDNFSNGRGVVTFSGVSLFEAAAVEPGNVAPVVVGGGVADQTIQEHGSVEIDLPFVDGNGDVLSYSFTVTDAEGTPVADFPLTVENGTLVGDLGDTDPGAYTITVTGSDGQAVATDSFVLTVENVNDAPVADPDAAFEPVFGAVGTAITPVDLAMFTGAFSDRDGDTLTFTADGLPAGLSVDATGVIRGTPTEAGTGSFTVVASDAGGLSASITVDLRITAPGEGDVTIVEAEDFTGLATATNFFATGQAGASGDRLIRVNGTKPALVETQLGANGVAPGWYYVALDVYDETDGSAKFTLKVGDTVLAENATFEEGGVFLHPGSPRGSAGQLGNLKELSFGQAVYIDGSTRLVLSGVGGGDALRTDRVVLTRTVAPNTAPAGLTLTGDGIAENAAGAVAGVLSATDAEGDAITFSVAPDSLFEIVGTTLKLKDGVAADFEAGATLPVAVTATDAKGASATTVVTVAVSDVDEAPGTPVLDAVPVAENAAGATIGTLTAVDGEGTALTFTVDDPRFEVVGGVLKLVDGVALDFETEPTVTLAVTADDGTTQTTGEVSFAVGDVNEAPVLTGAVADVTVDPAAGGSVDLSGLVAADPEGDAVTLEVRAAGGAALPEGVVLTGTVLTIPAGLDTGALALEVVASDGSLASAPVGFTVTVGEGAPFTPIVVQAEAGTITLAKAPDAQSTQVRDADHPETGSTTVLRPDFTGTGYVDYGNDGGDRLAITVNVAQAGTYDLNVRYASNTDRPLDLAVNGAAAGTLPFVSTDPDGTGPAEGFDHWAFATRTVTLAAGANVISLAIPAGAVTGPNLDRIEITAAGTGPIPAADTTADADGNLFLDGDSGTLNPAQAASVNFNLSGIDADIVRVEISFDGGATRTDITAKVDADGDFTYDASGLGAGAKTATVIVTDAVGNEASVARGFAIAAPANAPIVIQAEDASAVTVFDTGTGPTDGTFTRVVDASHPDAFGNYRAGAQGGAYIDFGKDAGDAISVAVDAPAAGSYTVTFRYANGGSADRPLALSVNGGAASNVAFAPTAAPVGGVAWEGWTDVTVHVDLAAGANTLKLAIPAGAVDGPNIDQITLVADTTGGGTPDAAQVFEPVVKINFEAAPGQGAFAPPAGYHTPDGYLSDSGAAYGDRGNGFTYGWVDVDGTTVTHTPLAQPTGSARYKGEVAGADDLQKTYLHFEYPGAPSATNERAFELAVENGTYELKLSIGDTAGKFDSDYVVNVEGQRFGTPFTPAALDGTSPGHAGQGAYDTALDGTGFRSSLMTGIVHVTDGKLTIDSIGGDNTEIQFLELSKIPDLTPGDDRDAELDYSTFIDPVAASAEDGQVTIAIGADGKLPTDIDPTSSFVIGVNLQAEGHRGPNIAHTDHIRLIETLTGREVPIAVQITGGADSMTIRPLTDLKDNTSYTLKVVDVLDLGSVSDPDAPLRQFQDLTSTFVTGVKSADVPREVAFTDSVQINGFADGAGGYTSVEFGPDGRLYVATITGQIHRFDVRADGTIDKASQETLDSDYFQQFAPTSQQGAAEGEGRRSIIGITFDPEDPNTIWITDNWPVPRESKAFNTPEFSGQISKVHLGAGGSLENATVETYITGLPRSGGDHVTNSAEFRANPDAGQPGQPAYLLYITQGSNSAAGEKDSAWGFRPEKLLNAAVLEVDPTREAPAGGFDVRTEPISLTDNPLTDYPESAFNADGTYPGSYNPFAADAVLKLYAVGIRNGFDLVWTQNDHLYVSANGTAAGGHSPDNPNTPQNEASTGEVPKQVDYFFSVQKDGYYGHANPRTGHYILNGGNPTSGVDKNEVGGNTYYKPGTLPEADYDIDNSYSLGFNKSPNGATEYTGTAFGSNLKGAVVFAQFSVGDNVRYILLDDDGKIIGDELIRRPDGSVIDNYIDPLDIIQNPTTGQLYLSTLNRSTGESKIILLTPAPGGITADLTADEGGDLMLDVVDASHPNAVVFAVTGLDADIVALKVAFDGGTPTTVTLDANGRFTFNLAGRTGPVPAVLTVTDGHGNTASDTASVSFGTSDATFIDATEFTVISTMTGSAASVIRRLDTPSTHEPTSGNDKNGDGLNDNYDGLGYLDPNGAAEAKATLSYDAPGAGTYTFDFRMANGSTLPRSMSFVVNGQTVTIADTRTASFTTWNDFEVTLTLTAGPNTITIVQNDALAPNIDSVVVKPVDITLPDTTADEGGDLAISVVDASNPAATVFAIAGLDADITGLTVIIDDGVRIVDVTPDANGRFTADISGLGTEVSVSLTVTDATGNTAETSLDYTFPGAVANDGEATVGGVAYVLYEAENATLQGAVVVPETTDDRDAQGTGYVDFVGSTDQSITWTIEVGADGTYSLDFLYSLSSAKAARPLALKVDGAAAGTLPFAPNAPAAENVWGPQTTTLNLTAGVHTITVTAPAANGPNIDQLRVTKAPVDATPDTTADEGGDLALSVVDASNPAAVTFAVAGLDADITRLTVSFDGGATTTDVTLTAGQFTADLTGRSGAITAVLVVRDGAANTASASAGFTLAPVVPNDGHETVSGVGFTVYEAENAAFTGDPAIVTTTESPRGQHGGAYVDPTTPGTDTVTWTVEVAEDGTYQVDILYALGAGKASRPMPISVDGTVVSTLPFAANSNSGETAWGPQTTTLALTAGVHQITVSAPGGNGPNLDYLRISDAPVNGFDPSYAAIDGTGRIELEATDGTAHVVDPSTSEFYFTVAADGVYALDLAANAGAPNGGGVKLYLTSGSGAPVLIDDGAFPGAGDAGETTAYTALQAGTTYKLVVVSDAPGASALDYLDVRVAPGDPDADIGIRSLDPAFFENRLHFSYIENPAEADGDGLPRQYKDQGQVEISNTGTKPLSILEAKIDGPFTIANPGALEGLVLAPGAKIVVTVDFDRSAYTPPTGTADQIDITSTIFTGHLNIRTNDADTPVATVDLAGFWQRIAEGGQEPNVNEVWKIFGFGNNIAGLTLRGGGGNSKLSTKDVYAKTDETEVLSPYWKIADGVTSAKITQLAAFHGPGGAPLSIHAPGAKATAIQLWNQSEDDNQTILPNAGALNSTTFGTKTFDRGFIPDSWKGADVFGIRVVGQSTDPTINERGDVEVPGAQQGHTVKVFQAVDSQGVAIPNTYLVIMDYTGINYDYNDNIYVIEGVAPVGFGGNVVVSGLDTAAADDRLVFTNIDHPVAGQAFRNEATFTLTNDGFAAIGITGVTLGGADAADFVIVGAVPTTLAAGAKATVTVRFIGSDPVDDDAAVLFKGTLTVTTDNEAVPTKVVQLAGLAQNQSEQGEEPTVAQIVEALGYTTDVAQGLLADGGKVETVGDEVLLPYLERLDGTKPVEVIQIAAFLNQGNVARFNTHSISSPALTERFAADDNQGQTVLPDGLKAGTGDTGSVAHSSFTPSGAFGVKITVDGRPTYTAWSDPHANTTDPALSGVNTGQGHYIRYFEAKDAAGHVIPGTYIGVQDYPGASNFDYNDHMFVIRNVKGHVLTAAEDANGDGILDKLQTDADGDGTVAFFDPNDTPDGALHRGAYVVGFNVGGPAVASQQGLGGVALRSDTDPLIRYAGDGATRTPGTDSAANANGANALPGAFKTYRDGKDWTVEVSGLKDGDYVVVLHTQETYWNTAGKRVFDMKINGTTVANDIDPFRVAGPDTPVSVEALVHVSGGKFTVALDSIGGDGIDNAALNAITVFASADAPGGGLAGANAAPVAAAITGVPGAKEGNAYAFDVAGFFSDPDGDALSFTGSGLPAGLTIGANGRITGTPTADGTYTIGVTASDGKLATTSSFTLTVADTPATTPVQTAHPGPTPGFTGTTLTVAAKNYDDGGQGVAYNDAPGLQGGTNGGRTGSAVEQTTAGDIGWIANGEWVEYTVNVGQAGTYDVGLLLATGASGRSFKVDFYHAGETVPYASTGSVANASTGSYTKFLDRHAGGLALDAGTQVVRVTFAGGGQDFRSLTLTHTDTNHAPVATAIGTQVAHEDASFALNIASYFSDPDGDALSYSATGLPTGLTLAANGTISGAPADGGTYTITVAASDGALSTSASFELDVAANPSPIGQAGSVTVTQASATQWHHVTFDQALDDPSVVMGPVSAGDKAPVTMRVRNVTSTGFDYQVDEWDYLDGKHGTETVSWMALEAGTHVIDGHTVVAGHGVVPGEGKVLGFGTNAFGANAPVVFAQVATVADGRAVTAQIGSVTANGFDVDLDQQESATTAHGAETVSWIAVERGGSASSGWLAGSLKPVTDAGKAIPFGGNFGAVADLVFLADMQTEVGVDTAEVRLRALSGTGATVFIEEEASRDAEIKHGGEEVGYLALHKGLLFGDDHIF